MAQERIHVVPHENGWAVKREGKADAESVHGTQKEATDAARVLAQGAETDLVVHRADGTFRKVYALSGEEEGDDMADRDGNGRKGRRIDASDVVSVGTRISWGAVLAGAAVALAVLIALGMLSTAIGLTARERLADRTALTLASICWIISLMAALFVGGFVTSRITAGEDKTEAMTYGVVLWGVLFAALTALTAAGANIGFNALSAGSQAKMALPSNFFEGVDVSKEDVEKLNRRFDENQRTIDPQAAAWWGFGGIILSIAAAVGGSLAGAGPTLVLRQIRERRTVPATTTRGAALQESRS